ncbi:hypothetical protein Vau01_105670 [Virgisporangium aurantiacum]|uniref:Uncharacterized protein n=2 Tax=Virgisporangium aurantiacum TaxID=175570 RepID=A0A8J3ZKA0_9ACTN|nr:hypothetical protein Vau01_105670 [Virgisporangium aurantiacum]
MQPLCIIAGGFLAAMTSTRTAITVAAVAVAASIPLLPRQAIHHPSRDDHHAGEVEGRARITEGS